MGTQCGGLRCGQGQLPCMTEDGRAIMAAPDRLATAPDGNGGVYAALDRCQGLCVAGASEYEQHQQIH
jgi:hypothetical protein